MAVLSHINLFAADIEQLSAFYHRVFGFTEVHGMRSPIYRLLDTGTAGLGFNAKDAYALLDLGERAQSKGCRFMLNFEVGSESEVSELADRALQSGGQVIKAPYLTYYGRIQAVLLDPEGNVFRLNYIVPAT